MRGSSEPNLEGFFGTIWKRIGQINEDCLLCFVALCLRAEEPETDATDGNVGEGRRELPAVAEPPSSSLNATLETFTQMMATMTQMLKNIQAPASGSGGGPIGGSSGGPILNIKEKCLIGRRYAAYGVEVGVNEILLSLEKTSLQKLISVGSFSGWSSHYALASQFCCQAIEAHGKLIQPRHHSSVCYPESLQAAILVARHTLATLCHLTKPLALIPKLMWYAVEEAG
ncbi:hypothetical protein M5K25_018597 [Dendrobium thyrsiflorum]|uniref:Uncharacterized protein n=1 Tax=Dendrobium thyrsiflorum TaxID=117978 RepID=A0ABD0UQY3_DENTH